MDTQQSNNKPVLAPAAILRFVLPSILCLILFLFPFSIDGNNTILAAALAQFLNEQLAPFLPVLILLIATSSATLAIICTLRRTDTGLLGELFGVSWPWLWLRIVGALIAILVFFEVGPEAVWGAFYWIEV